MSDHRGAGETEFYWSAYIVGIYEMAFVNDNDPDSEGAALGIALPSEPEGSFVLMEVVRDESVEQGWNATDVAKVQKFLSVHEVAHQFELVDDLSPQGTHVMASAQGAFLPNVPLRFRDSDIAKIRGFGALDTP